MTVSVLLEPVGFQPPPGRRQVRTRAKQAGVVGHVKHAQESQAPRVAVRVTLAPEHAAASVDRKRHSGVTLCLEDWTGSCVRIDGLDVGGTQGKVAFRVVEVRDRLSLKQEVGWRRRVAPTGRESPARTGACAPCQP